MLQEKLCQIGFTENESKVYLELLRIGAQPASTVAKYTGLNRTTVYSVLKALSYKGLVSSYTSKKVKYYVAADPNGLIGYVDRKCKTFDYYRTELLGLVPQFRALGVDGSFARPVVNFYDGREGVRRLIYESLRSNEPFMAYLSIHKLICREPSEFLIEYRNFRIKQLKLPLKVLVIDTPEVREYLSFERGAEVLFVDGEAGGALFEKEFTIFEDKVMIFSLDPGAEYGVVIESRAIAQMQKMVFEITWKGFENR